MGDAKKYLLDALNKMKEFTNNKLQNTLGFLTLILMTVAAVALLYFQFTRIWKKYIIMILNK